MIKVEKIEVTGWEAAVRGMRNPMNSWAKSDSGYVDGAYLLGPNDLDLMHRLYIGGPEHRKFMRMLVVTMDITAPLYWWKEYDTYKVGTVANSCSTMHKIHAKKFTLDDFSHEHLVVHEPIPCTVLSGKQYLEGLINALNFSREMYLQTKEKKWWWQMIQLLPTSYNQRRTVQLSYENAVTIIMQRSGHKLDEWRELMQILGGLPYLNEIMTGGVQM